MVELQPVAVAALELRPPRPLQRIRQNQHSSASKTAIQLCFCADWAQVFVLHSRRCQCLLGILLEKSQLVSVAGLF